MKKQTVKTLLDIYEKRYQKFGISPKSLGWDKNRARLRFNILASLWDLKGASILDFGCGFGDFYDFLIHDKKIKKITYTGIDINPTFVEIAKKRHPNGRFLVCTNPSELQQFDYIFASGIFNDNIPYAKKHIEDTITAIAGHCRKGFAVNFLSDKVQYRLPHATHTDPSWALALGYRFSNNIILRNDYMPFEFTLFVDLSTPFDKQTAIYMNYRKKHKPYRYSDLP